MEEVYYVYYVLSIKVTEKDFVDLVDESSKNFSDLETKNLIQEKEENDFKFYFKRATNVETFYS